MRAKAVGWFAVMMSSASAIPAEEPATLPQWFSQKSTEGAFCFACSKRFWMRQ